MGTFISRNTDFPRKTAAFDVAAGTNTIVAAVADKRVRVLAIVLTADISGTVKFITEPSTDISGTFSVSATGGFVLNENPSGWFETQADNKALQVVTATITSLDGLVIYQEVEA